MDRSKKLEQKRRRREKRQERAGHRDFQRFVNVVVEGERLRADASGAAGLPGAVDASIARPDLVKFALAQLSGSGRWKVSAAQFERDVRRGPIGFLPVIDHWAMELFFWKGTNSIGRRLIDEFLAQNPAGLTPECKTQFRGLGETRVGAFRIEAVGSEKVTLREWNPVSQQVEGPRFQAISLAISGVQDFAGTIGQVHWGCLGPWRPDLNLHCLTGYGYTFSEAEAGFLTSLLALNDLSFSGSPWPWRQSAQCERSFVAECRHRNWTDWLRAEMTFPCQAWVLMKEQPELITLESVPEFPAHLVKDFGMYLDGATKRASCRVGVSSVAPVDFRSRSFAAIGQYRSYRELIGLPPRAQEFEDAMSSRR